MHQKTRRELVVVVGGGGVFGALVTNLKEDEGCDWKDSNNGSNITSSLLCLLKHWHTLVTINPVPSIQDDFN